MMMILNFQGSSPEIAWPFNLVIMFIEFKNEKKYYFPAFFNIIEDGINKL